MASHGRYEQSPDAAASPVGDRIVLYHRLSRAAVVLNPTGSWMWLKIAEPRTAADLVGDLRKRFRSLSAEDAERDVLSFLHQLTTHAMVAIHP